MGRLTGRQIPIIIATTLLLVVLPACSKKTPTQIPTPTRMVTPVVTSTATPRGALTPTLTPTPIATQSNPSPVAKLAGEGTTAMWFEGWETAPVGVYVPHVKGELEDTRSGKYDMPSATYIEGDAGSWAVTDSYTGSIVSFHKDEPNLPEWSPHSAEIVQSTQGKCLSLKVPNAQDQFKVTNDLWVFIDPRVDGLSIPLRETTTLSFTVQGQLDETVTEPDGYVHSNYGFVGIALVDISGSRSIHYTIYEAGGWSGQGFGRKISLGKGGTYTRNLFDDYTKTAKYDLKGDETVGRILLIVKGPGNATFDDIRITW